jgi:hypothetical protein
MNQETDNENMQVGKNPTYMLVLRSILVRMDRYDGKMSKKKNVSKILHIRPITLIQKLIDPI